LPVTTQIRPVAGSGKALASQASPGPGSAKQWPQPRGSGGYRGRAGLDRAPGHGPRGSANADLCGTTSPGAGWADGVPGRLWPRPGPRRRDAGARAREVWAGPSANGGRRTRRKADGGIGCRCRSSTTGQRLAGVVVPVLHRVPPGRFARWQTWSRRRALMSGAMTGRNTPAGGGPVGTALRHGPAGGGKAADRVTVPRGPRYGCRNHRRPGRPG
jgi:hypothetical protein